MRWSAPASSGVPGSRIRSDQAAARGEAEGDQRHHGYDEQDAAYVAALVPSASLLDGSIGEGLLVLHDDDALLLGRLGHGLLGQPGATALDDLSCSLCSEVDLGAHSFGHALAHGFDESRECLVMGRVVSYHGAFAEVFARRWLAGEPHVGEHGRQFQAAGGVELELAREPRLEVAHALSESVGQPGRLSCAVALELDGEPASHQVVGAHERSALLLGGRLETVVGTEIGF